MKKSILIISLLTIPIVASSLPIYKTGITLSEVAGDDGDTQRGITRELTRDDSLEVVYDSRAKLMWQDNSEAKTIKKQWITQENYDAGNYSDTSGDTATTYCNNLNFAGYSDWRLPTLDELNSIVDYGRYNPAIDKSFQNIVSSYYWSSSDYVYPSSYAWDVVFDNGNDNYNFKSNDYYVRCVRTIDSELVSE